ncbi:DUF4222 domain-containing protein [Serratia rhizosphaerae]|uniref:DUF4222 domain-containing protein n=1 Tax=Serratia rhizosphaerae TaxID=2597702 RepID=A0ABX6GH17_9GAMM|nr:DUF4222 domain-containing protein [Serratia rhizosphaerae]QHA85566.1 DUF4222 domain-containing protein [Serratia rhizosphaerae]
MENEQIVPFEMDCHDDHGRLVHVIGVDQVNHRVIFRRPGYPYDCVVPRRDFGTKFKKVVEE